MAGGRKVLIIEDSPTQAKTLQLFLQSKQFEVEIASNGLDGLSRLANESFDLILSDIFMPGLNGLQLCAQIKSNPNWKAIPVILVTSQRHNSLQDQSREAGADVFLAKPYEPQELLDKIRRLLSSL